jgi:hypothetical protein
MQKSDIVVNFVWINYGIGNVPPLKAISFILFEIYFCFFCIVFSLCYSFEPYIKQIFWLLRIYLFITCFLLIYLYYCYLLHEVILLDLFGIIIASKPVIANEAIIQQNVAF